MKNKMGRPKLPKGEAKGVLIALRFTPLEAKQIDAAIKRAGQKKTQWMRNALLSAAA